MEYYCNECRKTISDEEFFYSMNRYKKALCSDHQRSRISGITKDLQDLVRKRHNDEVLQEIPELKTIKDWIGADLETWDRVLKKKDDDGYSSNVSEEDTENRYSKRIKNKGR